jgi:regulator of sirC expression with transglutaminase-like and TPR domain
LQRAAPAPERLALAIAGMAHADLDLTATLEQLDDLAEVMRRSLWAAPAGETRAHRFLEIFNQELGFTGNHEHYYEPANSFLNEVLARRTGLPIMLSLLCMALGRRLGLPIVGVGFPGHFMARYEDESGTWLLDPFHGAVVAPVVAEEYLARIFQRPVTLAPAAHAAVSPAALAQRILYNLRNVYLSRGDYVMNARVLDYLLILLPAAVELWQERGLMRYYTQQWDAAAHDLRRYFMLRGQNLLLLSPEQQRAPEQAAPSAQDLQLVGILRKIEEMQRRVN